MKTEALAPFTVTTFCLIHRSYGAIRRSSRLPDFIADWKQEKREWRHETGFRSRSSSIRLFHLSHGSLLWVRGLAAFRRTPL